MRGPQIYEGESRCKLRSLIWKFPLLQTGKAAFMYFSVAYFNAACGWSKRANFLRTLLSEPVKAWCLGGQGHRFVPVWVTSLCSGPCLRLAPCNLSWLPCKYTLTHLADRVGACDGNRAHLSPLGQQLKIHSSPSVRTLRKALKT